MTEIKSTILAGTLGTAIITGVIMIAPILGMPKMEGSMVLTAIGGLIGHIIFGMAVVKTVGQTYCSTRTYVTKTT